MLNLLPQPDSTIQWHSDTQMLFSKARPPALGHWTFVPWGTERITDNNWMLSAFSEEGDWKRVWSLSGRVLASIHQYQISWNKSRGRGAEGFLPIPWFFVFFLMTCCWFVASLLLFLCPSCTCGINSSLPIFTLQPHSLHACIPPTALYMWHLLQMMQNE